MIRSADRADASRGVQVAYAEIAARGILHGEAKGWEELLVDVIENARQSIGSWVWFPWERLAFHDNGSPEFTPVKTFGPGKGVVPYRRSNSGRSPQPCQILGVGDGKLPDRAIPVRFARYS